jgi:hypothetical protein
MDDTDLETCDICGTRRPVTDMVPVPAVPPAGDSEYQCGPEFKDTCTWPNAGIIPDGAE